MDFPCDKKKSDQRDVNLKGGERRKLFHVSRINDSFQWRGALKRGFQAEAKSFPGKMVE